MKHGIDILQTNCKDKNIKLLKDKHEHKKITYLNDVMVVRLVAKLLIDSTIVRPCIQNLQLFHT